MTSHGSKGPRRGEENAIDPKILVTRAGDGDAIAIQELMERHLASLRAYIRLRMGPRVRRWDSVSDVTQGVCLDILRNLQGFDYRGEAAFRQWLFTTAKNKLLEFERYWSAGKRDTARLASNSHGPEDGDDIVSREICRTLGSPSQMAIRDELLERISRALDRLSEETREVVLMSRFVGVPNDEIARMIGKEPSTVRSILSRALAQLAQDLSSRRE